MKRWLTIARRWLARLALVAAAGWVAGAIAWVGLSPGLVDMAKFTVPRASLTVTDRDGAPLRIERADGRHRRWVSLDRLPSHVLDAFLAAEDHRFFAHDGVDRWATARAAAYAITDNTPRSGASTITQQVVKLVYGRPHGRWSKPMEILRAVALEERRGKRWILEQYVNRVPYANEVEGVAAAAESYFGKDVADLTVAEAALLAGLPQAPSRLDPRRDREAARARRAVVIDRMERFRGLRAHDARVALAAPMNVRPNPRPWRAPRFVDAELARHREGGAPSRPGRIETSLDLTLQTRAEAILQAALDAHRGRGARNAAGVVLGPDGEVRAYVGAARRGPAAPGGQLDLLQARRQPGSTLKPFVYQLLFEGGGAPSTILDDVRLPMTGQGGALFEADNFDGSERGPVSARVALASSLNLAALDAARRVGAVTIVERLRELGFTDVGEAREHGAAIVLGGVDVTAMQLARAYQQLSRAPGAAAALTRDVLTDGATRRSAFGDDLEALAGGAFGLKTGTSSGFRDAWAAVFAEGHTVVVWFGDPDGRPTDALSGFAIAAPAAARVLAEARRSARGASEPDPTTPLTRAAVCPLSGRRPGPSCPSTQLESFAPGAEPTHVCRWHAPSGVVLPPRYHRWAAAMGRAQSASAATQRASGRARLRIVRPRDGDRLLVDPARPPSLELLATYGGEFAGELSWSVDGVAQRGPWRATPGAHVLTATYRGQTAEARLEVQAVD